ncbi:Ltp family lipoprotein [Nocardioides sp.]|uniref:Ltp family lipoprotein n=1 Tax=Nocardioides sp. TaxID=35761 RepID=UPI002623B910|nr:Ltp family lipoprotein [Nocardioides sp.]
MKNMRVAALTATSVLGLFAFSGCAGTTTDALVANASDKAGSTAKAKGSEYTKSQERAIAAAKQYLDTAPFSKAGLIRQLSSSAGSGYPKADAKFAVNHIKVDWNKQAYTAAKNYLDMSPMSLRELTTQLESSAGDGFTHAEAVAGATKAYNES